jgi:hypothetical protein
MPRRRKRRKQSPAELLHIGPIEPLDPLIRKSLNRPLPPYAKGTVLWFRDDTVRDSLWTTGSTARPGV